MHGVKDGIEESGLTAERCQHEVEAGTSLAMEPGVLAGETGVTYKNDDKPAISLWRLVQEIAEGILKVTFWVKNW